MPIVHQDRWVPVGVESLETAAETVVRSGNNTLVVAGPGAGKTELLAQRACYLLQTATCRSPRRLLAISFKRDAAKNLGERVRKRCGESAQRFDSFTLDSFAKGLVDRFRLALPSDWRPKEGYEVLTGARRVDDMRDWLKGAGVPEGVEAIDLEGISNDDIRRIFDSMAHGQVLPYADERVDPLLRFWGVRHWREQLDRPSGTPSLTFPMLNRLAAFLLRHNPKITTALRTTYAYVFLDEFQDTTAAQYDLVQAAFKNSKTIATAVGDSKQRIMLWAGAMAEVFEAYEADFKAIRHHLVRNYRSAPELVRMQHVIAQAVESGTPPAEIVKVNSVGSCVLMEFRNPESEAEYLAALIEKGLHKSNRKPRDYCVLVRQRTGEMVQPLKEALARRTIKLRDESQLQDILAEPVVVFVLAVMRLATRCRDAEAWEILTDELSVLLGLDSSDDTSRIEQEANRLLQYARQAVNAGNPLTVVVTEIVAKVGTGAFRSVYRQYARGSYLNDVLDGLVAALQLSLDTSATAREAVDDLVGVNVLPAMTIHKSKGLEFHAVIFLGLEDAQWWAFANQAEEEKRSFFVAFSRAIDHVYFTFCNVRDGRWGRQSQRKTQIGDLYTILRTAGVATVRYDETPSR